MFRDEGVLLESGQRSISDGQPEAMAMPLCVRAAALTRARRSDWDCFAIAASGSLLSSYDSLRSWRLKHRLGGGRVRCWEIFEAGAKIGQCAIGERRGVRTFRDRLLLATGYDDRWLDAMRAVLAAAGPGSYRYGCAWNTEGPREIDLAALPNVRIETVRSIIVQAVDFSRWPDWESYWAATSSNIRRNARAAESRIAGLKLATATGIGLLTGLPALISARAATSRRKALQFSQLRTAAGQAAAMLSARRHQRIDLASDGQRLLACHHTAAFGANSYLLTGGSHARCGGASWLLMRSALQRAHDRAPQGRFVMGMVDYALHDETIGGGLLRARRSCRVSDFPGSIVTFVSS